MPMQKLNFFPKASVAGTDSIFGKLKFPQFHNGRSRLKFSLYHHKIHRILHCRIVLYSFYISSKMYQLRCMSNHIERVVCLLTFVQLLRKVQKIFHGTTVLYSFYISSKRPWIFWFSFFSTSLNRTLRCSYLFI